MQGTPKMRLVREAQVLGFTDLENGHGGLYRDTNGHDPGRDLKLAFDATTTNTG